MISFSHAMTFVRQGRGFSRSYGIVPVAAIGLLGVSLFAAPAAFAQTIIEPTAVTSPQGSISGQPLGNIINQSGLSSTYTSGVTDFATFTSTVTHSGSSNEGFTNSHAGMPQQITFNLGAPATISAIAFWAANNIGTVTQFQLFADDDSNYSNGTSGQLGTTFSSAAGTGGANAAQVFTFASTTTQYVHLNVLNTQGGTNLYPGIGEVAFRSVGGSSAAPEPGSIAFLAPSGLPVVGRVVRRRRKAA